MHLLNQITVSAVCVASGGLALQLAIAANTPPGLRVYLQFFPADQAANNLGLTASNYGRVLTGI
jgi:hypothetical protein